MFYLVVSIWRITTTITGINALTFITGEALATSFFRRKVAQLSCNLFDVNLHIFTVKTAQLPPLLESTFCLFVSSADNVCTQFGPRSGLTNVGPDLDPIYLTHRWYSWKNIKKLDDFEQISRRQKSMQNYHPGGKELTDTYFYSVPMK